MTVEEMLKTAVKAADAKLATDIEVLDIRKLTTIADYFVICTGNSASQISAIADEIERLLKLEGETPLSVEGYGASSWLLMDYASVVVHVFRKEMREFYSIERLWSDAVKIPAAELLK